MRLVNIIIYFYVFRIDKNICCSDKRQKPKQNKTKTETAFQ